MISSCDDDNPVFKASALAGATAGPTETTQEPDIETVDTRFVGARVGCSSSSHRNGANSGSDV